mgnify:CR=1 FL=1
MTGRMYLHSTTSEAASNWAYRLRGSAANAAGEPSSATDPLSITTILSKWATAFGIIPHHQSQKFRSQQLTFEKKKPASSRAGKHKKTNKQSRTETELVSKRWAMHRMVQCLKFSFSIRWMRWSLCNPTPRGIRETNRTRGWTYPTPCSWCSQHTRSSVAHTGDHVSACAYRRHGVWVFQQ